MTIVYVTVSPLLAVTEVGLVDRLKSGGPEYVGDAVAVMVGVGIVVPDRVVDEGEVVRDGVPANVNVGRGSGKPLPPPSWGKKEPRKRAAITRTTTATGMNG
jgi:hypothetical protein